MPKQTPSNPKRTGARVVPIRGTSTPTKPAASKPPTLAPIQELLCELAGDLIVRGGNREESENLARVLLRHQFRTSMPGEDALDDSTESSMRAWEYSEKWLPDWLAKWYTVLAKTAAPDPAGPTARESVSERIRANFRSQLSGLMEEFVTEASPEELGFMIEVFEEWDSAHLVFSHGDAVQEIYIAEACSRALGEHEKDSIFVKVPERLMPAVQRLARLETETA